MNRTAARRQLDTRRPGRAPKPKPVSRPQPRPLEKSLPTNVAAEKAILGCVVLNNNHMAEARKTLRPDDFSTSLHRMIYAHMLELDTAGQPIDTVTLLEGLNRRNGTKPAVTAAYLSHLGEGLVDRPSIAYYVEILRKKAGLRELAAMGDTLYTRATESDADLPHLLALTKTTLEKVETSMRELEHGGRDAPLDAASLIEELEAYFARRLYLLGHGSFLLALWTLHTWCFDVFDTTPYLLVESATRRCGKTTVLTLVGAACRHPVNATSPSEAALFRVIDQQHPTLLIDEAESLAGRSERAETLRGILHVGYKQGAKVPRCIGEGKGIEVKLFDTYCPKAIASIGGLRDALLDRCVVFTMQRRPAGVRLNSSREHRVRLVSAPLRNKIEAQAEHLREAARQLYELEPETSYWADLSDREAELWTPLLTIARIAGPIFESRALELAQAFSRTKAEQQAEEREAALTQEVFEVLLTWHEELFAPGDLVKSLEEDDTWGEILAGKKNEKEKAAAVGRFFRRFRPESRKRSHGKTRYERTQVLEKLAPYIPAGTAPSAPSAPEPLESLPYEGADGPGTAGADETRSTALSHSGADQSIAGADAKTLSATHQVIDIKGSGAEGADGCSSCRCGRAQEAPRTPGIPDPERVSDGFGVVKGT